MINGIILINKPQDFTSFDVIAKMRGILKQKKLGHSGTLDPMATGVLPVFAGSAAKAISIMPKKGKSYTAGFKFGIKTDTYDITGKVTEQSDKTISREMLDSIIIRFEGNIKQLPPMYSAVKVGGKRLYELARKGIETERPEREAVIKSLVIKEFDEQTQEGVFDIECSQGTYVRSIIHDIGEALGCGGVMTSLVRTRSDGFELCDCITLEELEELRDKDEVQSRVMPCERLFDELPEICFDEKQTFLYKNGVKLPLAAKWKNEGSELFRAKGFDGEFIGIAKADRDAGILRVCKNLSGDRK